MSDREPTVEQDSIDVRQLANAIRFAVFAIVFGLSCLGLRISQSINDFARFYQDMLGGKPLPLVTEYVLSSQSLFIAVSLIIATIAMATLFFRRVVVSLYVLGGLGFVAAAESVLLHATLTLPFVQV